MKIKYVDETKILFDTGFRITFTYDPEVDEHNYAYFTKLDPVSFDMEYPETLIFRAIDGEGFQFGGPNHMAFIPCISEQLGKYNDEIDILFNGKPVLTVGCRIENPS